MFFGGLLCAQKNLAGEAELRQKFADLASTGSVMMIAAHPDDENTALLAYFARGRHMRTAYLSLTRGEGGQNLLGSEQGAALGVIRTQELLAARRIDGAEQYFTRAIDFGFSKTAADTFSKWPREKVLGDIVWDIRRFRPDVIVLRFSGTPRDGHGQHQVSAILGQEAFTVAADPSKYPEQLQWVQPWQAKRLVYNVISFTAEQEREAAKMADKVELDIGQFNPELGYSYGEIAGMSRSQHRSQGMGAPEQKGSIKNYLIAIGGDRAAHDPFEGIDTTWTRFPDGAALQADLDQAAHEFVPAHPEQILKPLAAARPRIAAIKDPVADFKLKQLDSTLALCAGLWLDATSDRYSAPPGGSLKVNFTVVMRLPAHVALNGINLTGMDGAPSLGVATSVLVENQPSRYSAAVHIPDAQPFSQPYWLVAPPDGWLYTVADPRQIGDPENPPALEGHFHIKVAGADLDLTRPAEYRYVDRVYGETLRPLAIVPPVAVNFFGSALVFPNTNARRIEVPLRANTSRVAGEVQLEAPAGWHVEPASQHFDLALNEQQTTAAFNVIPPSSDSEGALRAVATVGDRRISAGSELIAYSHIPTQTLFPPAETKVVRADVQISAKNIGYVMGAGDDVPDALRQMGAQVTLLSADDLAAGDLSHFDSIVTGVRAFNTRADLRANIQRVFDYVQNGGAMIVQYNAVEGGPFGGDSSLLEHIGPYPITLSRDRVTDTNAPVVFPNPENPLLHSPNPIGEKDFSGWVQERGLNFASEWDPKYQSVLESHDPGEEPHPGGELYVRYGKGVYVFSAYSWFRELPAGVAGAYRLFANLVSAAKVQ